MGGACGKGAKVHQPENTAGHASRSPSVSKPSPTKLQIHAQLIESEKARATLEADLLRHKLQGIERENNRLIEALAKSSEVVRAARKDVAESRTWRNTAGSYHSSTPTNTPTHKDRFVLVAPVTPKLSTVESDGGEEGCEEVGHVAPDAALDDVAGVGGRDCGNEIGGLGIKGRGSDARDGEAGGTGSVRHTETERDGRDRSGIREDVRGIDEGESGGGVYGDGLVGGGGGDDDEELGVEQEDQRGGGAADVEEWDIEEEKRAAEEQAAMKLEMSGVNRVKESVVNSAGGVSAARRGAEGDVDQDMAGLEYERAEVARQQVRIARMAATHAFCVISL